MTTKPVTTLAPTTLATTTAPTTTATTAAPTTLATTVLPTTLATTSPPTTPPPTTPPPPATTVAPTTYPPAPATAAPDEADEIIVYPTSTKVYPKPIKIGVGLSGDFFEVVLAGGPIEIGVGVEGTGAEGIVGGGVPIEIVISLKGDQVLADRKCNWVAWSKVGSLDFTIDETNKAGERVLDWKGCVWELLKLGKAVVAYGDNGVSVLNPVDLKWGLQTIHKIGIANKGAAIGTEFEHYFIDKYYRLYKLTQQGIELLDYSEYLEVMSAPQMSLDLDTGFLYICDGTYGFVYSTKTKSFGSGPVDVSGIGVQSGLLYVASPDTEIEIPKFNICTDIYDLGTRKFKTIQWIEVGTDLTNHLEAMIEMRQSNRDPFIQSTWNLVNPSGIAFIPAYGLEFKFHLRSVIYEYLEVDYIKVLGTVHGAGYLDTQG